jgi:hypothetical protein
MLQEACTCLRFELQGMISRCHQLYNVLVTPYNMWILTGVKADSTVFVCVVWLCRTLGAVVCLCSVGCC